MSMELTLTVHPFRADCTDKEQAVKVLEEAAEVYGAWQTANVVFENFKTCGLNRSDMNMQERECEVLGKGRKRRTCYFSAEAKMYLERYLGLRVDENPAAIVSMKRPFRRMTPSAIEGMVRRVGRRAGVNNTHPHRFRRTMATNNLRRGMKLEEIQQLLGHSNMDTTLIYAKVDRELLKVNARRLS